MRQFYLEYKDNEKMQTLSAEIGWSKRTYNMAFVTRNVSNIKINKVKLINPWL